MGTADLPNFFRRPYGPGWALVGDAGDHKDPITGQGISDAFRDAETLAAALDTGFSGRQPLEQALTQCFGVLDGTVSVPEFFAPENIERIMAAVPAGGTGTAA